MIASIAGAPIYIETLDSVTKHQELLKPYVEDEKFWRSADEWISRTNTTHNHPQNNLLPWNDIIPEINEHFVKYIQIFEPTGNFEIETYPWLNKYFTGDWQENHNHIASNVYFSMAYIIEGNNENNFVFSEEANTWHSCLDSEGIFNKWPIRQFVPDQPNGTLMIFPSTIDHFVLPNKSQNCRITASANFALIKD